jgi:tetratricopeptide (TPR) repeat protein
MIRTWPTSTAPSNSTPTRPGPDRAIQLDPESALFIDLRGQACLAMGRYDQALADLDRAIELDPTNDEFAAARTETCQLTGRSDPDDVVPGNRETKAT